MDINLFIHSVEVELAARDTAVGGDEQEEENVVYCLHIKVESGDARGGSGPGSGSNGHPSSDAGGRPYGTQRGLKNEMPNGLFYETPWYMCVKKGQSEICLMSYEVNISHVFNMLERDEGLALYVLRKDLNKDKVDYLHRSELNMKNKRLYDRNYCILFENDNLKGKIKVYLKNGIIYNHTLGEIKTANYLKDVHLEKFLPSEFPTEVGKEQVEGKIDHRPKEQSGLSQDKHIINEFNELLNERRVLYWVYIDDNGKEQGPFNSNTIFTWIINEYFEDDTLIRLHDKGKFYKLCEVIGYIEKNVLLNSGGHELVGHNLGDSQGNILRNSIIQGVNTNGVNTNWDVSKGSQTEKQTNFIHRGDATQNDMGNYAVNKSDIYFPEGGYVGQYMERTSQKLNDAYSNEVEAKKPTSTVLSKSEDFSKGEDAAIHNKAHSNKNVKKKNQVKRLKREIKRIKDEMVKLKESASSSRPTPCDDAEVEARHDWSPQCGEDGASNLTSNAASKKNSGATQEESHISTSNNVTHETAHIGPFQENVGRSAAQNNAQSVTPGHVKEGVNYLSNAFSSEANLIEKIISEINEEFRIKENHQKQRCVEIAMSSISQAQECLLNIKKKRMTSYLNRIINLSIHDEAIYIGEDNQEMVPMERRHLKKKAPKNGTFGGARSVAYGVSCEACPTCAALCANRKKAILNRSAVGSIDEVAGQRGYLHARGKFSNGGLESAPRRRKEVGYSLVINGGSPKSAEKVKLVSGEKWPNGSFQGRSCGGVSKEQATTLCLNRQNNEEVVYNYYVTYDQFLKCLLLIQRSVRMWLSRRKRRSSWWSKNKYDVCNSGELGHCCSFRSSALSGNHGEREKKPGEDSTRIKKEKYKTDIINRIFQNVHFVNNEKKDVHESYVTFLEQEMGNKMEGRKAPTLSPLLRSVETERDNIPVGSPPNGDYLFNKKGQMNKHEEDELKRRCEERGPLNRVDKLHSDVLQSGGNSLRREDTEKVKQMYGVKREGTSYDQEERSSKQNVHELLCNLLSKYKSASEENGTNEKLSSLQPNEQFTRNLEKYNSFLKSIEKKDISGKRDTLLSFVNNLKFDNILGEKKKNCQLETGLKSGSAMPTPCSFLSYRENPAHNCSYNDKGQNGAEDGITKGGNNTARSDTKLAQIKFLQKGNFFCKNFSEKEGNVMDHPVGKNSVSHFLLNKVGNKDLKNTVTDNLYDGCYSDRFMGDHHRVFITKR
ncbi:GYF domain-containing protein, putative [Plasmodium vivax]|nr:GYF domain-containing protein, putative [Plasmodium vivax]